MSAQNRDSVFLLIDEDGIDNGAPPNFFASEAVNDHIAMIGQRAPLPAFSGANIGQRITLYSRGWYALKTIPALWQSAGPTPDGLRNFIASGPGLEVPTRTATGKHSSTTSLTSHRCCRPHCRC